MYTYIHTYNVRPEYPNLNRLYMTSQEANNKFRGAIQIYLSSELNNLLVYNTITYLH